MNNFKLQGNGSVKKSSVPAWKIEQEKLNRELAKYRQQKINEGIAIANQLQEESEKMINTEGMEDLNDYFMTIEL